MSSKIFYQIEPEPAFRFGDVIRGFISSIPKLKEPALDSRHPNYDLVLSMPTYSVVLSPCCSIGDSTLTLAPLDLVKKNLFTNPYFVEDMTRINRFVPPEKSLPPDKWGNLSEEQKQQKLSQGNAYVFAEYFIYAEHEVLPKYFLQLRGQNFETGYYMIDFRKSFRVSCEKVQSANNSPIEAKVLQLSVQSRQDLRNKISWYYSRPPQEDLALLQSL